MNLRCLIVDDEPPAIKIIENYLGKLKNVEIAGTARNVIEAMEILKHENVDVIFLDINMPEISGMSMLKIMRVLPVVILTTAYSDYALESYEYDVADYLLKPFRFERFVKAVEKARALVKPPQPLPEKTPVQDFVEFKVNGTNRKILLDDILYLQSLGNYIKIFTHNKRILSLQTTREMEESLPRKTFVRIHKSYIVNISKISDYSSEFVFISNAKLPIGKTYKKYFFEQMSG